MRKTNIYTVASIVFAVIIISVGGYLWYQKNNTVVDTYTNDDYGVSFTYPDSYKLTENKENDHTLVTLTKKGFSLPKNGEGSTAITVDMIHGAPAAKGGKSPADIWITTATSSNFHLSSMKSPGATRVDEQDARLYTWDGLYPATTVVTSTDGNILMFTVTYDGITDSILNDFTSLMESVKLRSATTTE